MMLTPTTLPGARELYERKLDALLRVKGSGLRMVEWSLARRELGLDDIDEMLEDLKLVMEFYRLTRG